MELETISIDSMAASEYTKQIKAQCLHMQVTDHVTVCIIRDLKATA